MADVNWNLALANPIDVSPGIGYAQKIMALRDAKDQKATQVNAGQKFAAGDYTGASSTLANSGDIAGATKVAEAQNQLTEQHLQYAGRAANVLNNVYDSHIAKGETPEQATAAVLNGFDSISHEIPTAFGGPQDVAQFRTQLATDPKGTLTNVSGMVAKKLSFQKAGNGQILALDQSTGQQVGQPMGQPEVKAPTVHSFTDGNSTVDKQFNNKTGEWEVLSSGPRYKPAAAGGGMGGEGDEPLSDDALGHQVGMYISSRGNIMPQFGMGKPAAAARSKFYNALGKAMDAGNITDADIASGKAEYKANASALTNVSKQLSSVGSYEATVQKNMGILESLIGKGAPQGSAPVVNRWLQAGRRSLQGDPDVSAYDTAIKTVTAEYAKVMSGGTGSSAASSDSARQEAEGLLNGAQTPAQVHAVINTMRREMANRIGSLKEQANSLKSSLGNRPEAAGDQPHVRVFNPATGRLE